MLRTFRLGPDSGEASWYACSAGSALRLIEEILHQPKSHKTKTCRNLETLGGVRFLLSAIPPVCICNYMSIYIYVHVHINLHICIRIYTHTKTYTHIYIYVYELPLPENALHPTP